MHSRKHMLAKNLSGAVDLRETRRVSRWQRVEAGDDLNQRLGRLCMLAAKDGDHAMIFVLCTWFDQMRGAG